MKVLYLAVSGLLFSNFEAPIAMETGEVIEMKIASNGLFSSGAVERCICMKADDKDAPISICDYTKMGFKIPHPTYKQFEYEINLIRARNEYTLLGLPFKPHEFWEKYMDEQLTYLKDVILGFDLLIEAPKHHKKLDYVGIKKNWICGRPGSYSEELEEKFELAVWEKLSKDYKITLEDFKASLRSALKPGDRLYKAPLLMHFTNYLVPRYEFYYEGGSYDAPYKTLKYPSIFELANGAKDEGVVVYEREK